MRNGHNGFALRKLMGQFHENDDKLRARDRERIYIYMRRKMWNGKLPGNYEIPDLMAFNFIEMEIGRHHFHRDPSLALQLGLLDSLVADSLLVTSPDRA